MRAIDGRSLVLVTSNRPERETAADGIYLFTHEIRSSQLRRLGSRIHIPGASFLTLHPDRKHLYVASTAAGGRVGAFEITPQAGLAPLGWQQSGDSEPCYVAVHPGGRYLLTANYAQGSIAAHPISNDGSLAPLCDLVRFRGRGSDPERQAQAHAHMVVPDTLGLWILSTDLGTDTVRLHNLDRETGHFRTYCALQTPPGSGPRHLVYHPSGYVYVTAELDSTVLILKLNTPHHSIEVIGRVRSTRNVHTSRNYPSNVVLSEDNRYCYVGNRGADCITLFKIAGSTLEALADIPTGGAFPRHLTIAHGYLYATNEHSDSLAVFALETRTGLPQAISSPIWIPRPTCVLVRP